MAKFTHTIMPHSLAKALIDAGVQHLDLGGNTTQGTATDPYATTNLPTAQQVQDNPVQAQVQAANPIKNAQNDIGAVATATGGIMGGFGAALTPQDQYLAGLAPIQTTNYGDVIASASGNALSGYGTNQNLLGQQQQLANALLARSRGQGPNPAQAALNANTGQNVQSTAALMAGQRGAGANVGLESELAARQGAGIQQNAVGQAATLQAQQEIAAQQALQQQQQNMQNANLGEQGANNTLFGSAAGAQNAQNNTEVTNYNDAQSINAKTAGDNAAATQKTTGGLINGAGGALAALFAKGGKVPSHLHEMAKIYHPDLVKGMTSVASDFRSGGSVAGKAQIAGNSVKNDTVPAMLSPGETVLPRSVTQSKNAPQKAAEFVKHLQGKEDSQKGYSKVAETKRSLKGRVERLEKLCLGGAA